MRLLPAAEPAVDFIPVYDIPPRGQVVGTPVLVLQIVGVLPNIVAQHMILPVRDRIVLVGCAGNFEFAVIGPDQPGPTAAELLGAGLIELGLHLFEASKAFCDGIGYWACRLTTTVRPHNGPEH